ncbi:MAG: L-fucose/L-arabinose isomerase family protein [Limnochordia bacterium]|jgi:L-fucose isomerase-like protein
MSQATFGVIVGNRGCFPSHLCESGRSQVLEALEQAQIKAITLSPEETAFGTVESFEDARRCAELFDAHRKEIDGILITLPNFGDERAIADSLRMANLNVPVLVHAFPDDPDGMGPEERRDSFCGKISVCNNLRQYGIRFSLTQRHTLAPSSPEFRQELQSFSAVCRIVRGLRGARIGALGARPAKFNTMRYNEKLLERHGISVEPLDLSEAFGQADRLSDTDGAVQSKLAELKAYVPAEDVPETALIKMAKFGLVIDRWIESQSLAAIALQCWNSIETYFGIAPCAVMSMLSQRLLPAACEVDVVGALTMHVLQLATGTPSALVDWNNNYGDAADKVVLFHCSNLPKCFLQSPCMSYQAIAARDVGQDQAYGTVVGRIKAGSFTFARISEIYGNLGAYVGEGEFIDDRLTSFGGYGIARIIKLQQLLRYICESGFEHHVAVTQGNISRVVAEALGRYLGWHVYHHI